MKITFEAHPIATAPKDREIMLYLSGTWHPGEWDGLGWRLQGLPYGIFDKGTPVRVTVEEKR